jgi:hypothetical protein
MKSNRIQRILVGAALFAAMLPLAAAEQHSSAKRSVTVIDHEYSFRDAWIGYSDGTVRYCLGGGESTGPTWANCAEAGNIPDVAVTAISADGKFREAWVGYANGELYRCKGGADLQQPWTSCNRVPD